MRSSTTTTCSISTTKARSWRTRDNQDLGVNTGYSDGVHNDLNDNSGCVRCRELLIRNLRNFGCEQHCTKAEAEAKLSS